ncbi:hypothetical protein [Pseudomonas grimontii]|uniref:hypothetical protein n=1 Tax=Pseudomonas grimontii TaxID=129847 RepID=UPI00387B1EFD
MGVVELKRGSRQLTTEPDTLGRVIALRRLGRGPPGPALGGGALSGILAVGVAIYTLRHRLDRPK